MRPDHGEGGGCLGVVRADEGVDEVRQRDPGLGVRLERVAGPRIDDGEQGAHRLEQLDRVVGAQGMAESLEQLLVLRRATSGPLLVARDRAQVLTPGLRPSARASLAGHAATLNGCGCVQVDPTTRVHSSSFIRRSSAGRSSRNVLQNAVTPSTLGRMRCVRRRSRTVRRSGSLRHGPLPCREGQPSPRRGVEHEAQRLNHPLSAVQSSQGDALARDRREQGTEAGGSGGTTGVRTEHLDPVASLLDCIV